MPFTDPDIPDPRQVNILAGYFEEAAQKLRKIIEDPTVGEWNHRSASIALAQITQEIKKLKLRSAQWIGTTFDAAARKGSQAAIEQLKSMGLKLPESDTLKTGFNVIDIDKLKVLARDSFADVTRTADSAQRVANIVLRKMADNGLTGKEVNQIIARGTIAGKPQQIATEIRDRLIAIHGNTVPVPTKNGGVINFGAGYYGKMVAHTRSREASIIGRHDRLQRNGIDLVIIEGRISKNFCTHFVGRVFSLSGESKEYPPYDDLPDGGPPFHPNCSKTTAPFIAELESAKSRENAKMDDDDPILNADNATQAQRAFRDTQGKQEATQRHTDSVAEIRARAAATGFKLPAWSPSTKGVKP